MSVRPIQSLDDPKMADFGIVSDPRLMRSRGLFLVEGYLAVTRLLASRFEVQALLLTNNVKEKLMATFKTIDEVVDIYVGSNEQLKTLTGFKFHRGCLGLGVRRPSTCMEDFVFHTKGRPIVLLDAVSDPDNVGSIFRSAAAFGVAGIALSPSCADPLYRKAIRTSMATTLHLPYVVDDEWPHLVTLLRKRKIQIVAFTLDSSATELESFVGTGVVKSHALVFGNEGLGISDSVLAECDIRVRIETERFVDSLNVATTAAIALQRFQATRAAS